MHICPTYNYAGTSLTVSSRPNSRFSSQNARQTEEPGQATPQQGDREGQNAGTTEQHQISPSGTRSTRQLAQLLDISATQLWHNLNRLNSCCCSAGRIAHCPALAWHSKAECNSCRQPCHPMLLGRQKRLAAGLLGRQTLVVGRQPPARSTSTCSRCSSADAGQ